MKKKYQNGFFIFGLVVLIIMVSQLDFEEVWAGMEVDQGQVRKGASVM